MFHKPIKADTFWPEHNQVIWLPPKHADDYLEYEVEGVLKNKIFKKNGNKYLLKWWGYHKKELIWLLAKEMENARKMIENFERNRYLALFLKSAYNTKGTRGTLEWHICLVGCKK